MLVTDSPGWHAWAMIGSIRARQQRQVATGKAHCVAAYVCLVIVHLVLIHTLHLTLSPPSSMAHHQAVGTQASHASVTLTESPATDISCSAPNFVSQRDETVVSIVLVGPLTTVTAESPRAADSPGTNCDLPRPSGPARQALLQRFTL